MHLEYVRGLDWASAFDSSRTHINKNLYLVVLVIHQRLDAILDNVIQLDLPRNHLAGLYGP